MPDDEKILTAIQTVADVTGTALSADAQEFMVRDLAGEPLPSVLAALQRCARECRRLTLADIRERLPRQRPPRRRPVIEPPRHISQDERRKMAAQLRELRLRLRLRGHSQPARPDGRTDGRARGLRPDQVSEWHWQELRRIRRSCEAAQQASQIDREAR